MARVVDAHGTHVPEPGSALEARGVRLRQVVLPPWGEVRDDVLAAAEDPTRLPPGLDLPAALVAELLPAEADRIGVRGLLVVQGVDLADAAAGTGFGVPHFNESSECHLVLGGRGVFGYPSPEGELFVGVEHGDVVAMRQGTVHRFAPLEEQAFVLRFDAEPGGDLVAHDLDVETSPWIDPWGPSAS